MSSRLPTLCSTHRIAMPNIGKPAGGQNFLARALHSHIKHVHGRKLPLSHSLCIGSATACMLRSNCFKYARHIIVCGRGDSRSDLCIQCGMCGCSCSEPTIAIRAPRIRLGGFTQAHRYEFRPCTTVLADSQHQSIRHSSVTAQNTVARWVCSSERNLNASTFSELHNFRVWSVRRTDFLHAIYLSD